MLPSLPPSQHGQPPLLPPSTALRIVDLPFGPSDHGLPHNVENTETLPYPFVSASSTPPPLSKSFHDLLLGLVGGGRKPLYVIANIFFDWTATVCRELGIFHDVFSGANGFGLACDYSVWREPEGGEVAELATARESSGRNFIWVVRPPVGNDMNAEFDAGRGCSRGSSGRGLLVERWAPQAEILAHGTMAEFLTSCERSSVLSNGVTLLGWSMAAELGSSSTRGCSREARSRS